MAIMLSIIFIVAGYIFGAIPVGYVVARLYGVDVTASGSGRIGGTNVLRSAGVFAAGLTVLGDVLKGLIPVYIVSTLGWNPLTIALTGSAAVLGHNYSIFLGFRGGVGAGTAIGVLSALSFPIGLITATCGLIALVISRYASILSTTIAISGLIFLSIWAWLDYIPYAYIVTGVLNLILMLYALRENFARLRAGTERRIGQKTENIVKISGQ